MAVKDEEKSSSVSRCKCSGDVGGAEDKGGRAHESKALADSLTRQSTRERVRLVELLKTPQGAGARG